MGVSSAYLAASCHHRSSSLQTFPFLTYYCQTIGAGMSYCDDVNRHMATKESAGAKVIDTRARQVHRAPLRPRLLLQSFAYRRLARSLRAEHPGNAAAPDMKTDTDVRRPRRGQRNVNLVFLARREIDYANVYDNDRQEFHSCGAVLRTETSGHSARSKWSTREYRNVAIVVLV